MRRLVTPLVVPSIIKQMSVTNISISGASPKLTWAVPNKHFTMDCSNLFPKDSVFQYEVSLGTIQGGADIIQWQETKWCNMTTKLETVWQNADKYYATITAVSPTGLYTTFVHTTL
jgi:hypothetical protein